MWPPPTPPAFASTSASATTSTIRATSFSLRFSSISPPSLEPEVLQGLGGAPVQARGLRIVSTARGEIALGDPRCGTVARRLVLVKGRFGNLECCGRLVEPALLEQRTAEHELRVADLVEAIFTVVEQRERVTRLLF